MKNRFRGVLVGAAVGDSMGMCVEELPMDEIILHYGDKITELCEPHPASPASFLKKGENSSEFEIVEMVAQSLAEKRRLDIRDIIERYIDWYEREETHSYVDPSFLVGIEALKEGREISRGGSSVEGVLPAIPVGMYHYTNPILAVEGTKAVVMLTHRNEIALDSASILAVAIGELLQGRFYLDEEYGYFIELLKTFVQREESKFYLDRVKALIEKDASYEDAIDEIGNGSYALEAVSQALFIFLKTPEDTETAVINAVNSYGNYGGDTDAIGLITGAFAGAYNGEESIPARWKTKLVKYKDIQKLADRLYRAVIH
ncbi:hypothetical protein GWK41_03730 [Persephonella atlantica]|uniref:ADP-ribosylglycohydrolase n=1 Tax=Persephonella atlantica TaxID=2699429 RepID=A0ABS1GGW3_9AQUI|nr:ADP-ribosylglycohydrolase family protein [Persephonella atlantica]MBK3332177.1 hypothetical protein [Persephonella atlantica]